MLAANYSQNNTAFQSELLFKKALFLFCPTGAFCREDRCQSFFNFELIPSMRAPLEECEIGGVFKNLGLRYELIDAPAAGLSQLQFERAVLQQNPDLIIIAVTFGSLDADLHWVQRLKRLLPRAVIGLRGAPCYVWHEELIKQNPALDFCVRGEYERSFESIVKEGLQNAPGVTSRKLHAGLQINVPVFEEDLDKLPVADRTALDSALYKVRWLGKRQASIRVQRGCPFPCSYCLVHTVSGAKARHRTAPHIAAEMESLLEQGIRHFYLRAETFSINKKWAIALAKEIAKRCPTARWVTTTRVECVDAEIVQAMREAGCYGISFGVDVASEKVGALVRKPPRLEEAGQAMRLCDRYGVISLAYFMLGFIWDSPQTIQECRSFIKKIRPDLLTIHFAHPYPGTKYYEDVKATGAQIISLRAQAEPALSCGVLSSQALRREARKILMQHYARPAVLASLGRKALRLAFER